MPISQPNTRTPGVKIQEVQLAGPPIVGVGTSTAGFVGLAPKDAKFKNVARLVSSADQFVADYVAEADGTIAAATKSTPLSIAVDGFFRNGGTSCYVVNVGTANAADVVTGLKLLETIDAVAIIAAPGFIDATVYKALSDQAKSTGDRVAILDPPAKVADRGDLLKTIAAGGKRPDDTIWAGFYYPRIKVPAPLKGDGPDPLFVAPSGHVAGIYAQVDASEGVHKAPANVAVAGAIDVEDAMTDSDQNLLNAKGVNIIRLFSEGPVVWGARTVQDESAPLKSEFLYISTRRLTNYIEESLQNGLRFAVFEPNTLPLRQRIARSVRGFLDGVWRDGALFGATPDEAYYVRFPDVFNTDDDRAKGRLTIEVGLRVAFPAEFIIIRIGLMLQAANAS